MSTRMEDHIDRWDTRPFPGGFDALADLENETFSGAVRAGGACLLMLNGRIVGVVEGTIDDFDGVAGTAHEAPHPALPLLFAMTDVGGTIQARYYTEDTPLSEVEETLTDASFTGYVELSENVLSGDYYQVYYGGRSMNVAFVGNTEELLTDDEAVERTTDEVGIYEVIDVDIEIVDIPGQDDESDASSEEAAPETSDEQEESGTASEEIEPDVSVEDDEPEAGGEEEPTAGDGLTAEQFDGRDADPAPGSERPKRAAEDPPPAAERSGPESQPAPETAAGTRPQREPPESRHDAPHAPHESHGATDATQPARSPADPSQSTREPVDSTRRERAGSTPEPREPTHRTAADPTAPNDRAPPERSRRAEQARPDDHADQRSPPSDTHSDARSEDGPTPPSAPRGRSPNDRSEPSHGRERTGGSEPERGADAAVDSTEPPATDRSGRAIESDADLRRSDPVDATSTGTPTIDTPSGTTETAAAEPAVTEPDGTTAHAEGTSPSPAELDDEGGDEDDAGTDEADWVKSELDWQQTRQIPSLDPELTGSDRPVDPLGAVDVSEAETIDEDRSDLGAELLEREGQIKHLSERVAELDDENDELRSEREELRSTIERLEAEVERLETRLAGGGDNAVSTREAIEGSNLFVRYGSKGEATLEDAHGRNADADEVNANLQLEHHTRFDADEVEVEGQSYGEFIEDTMEYGFVEWLVRELLYEIDETGNRSELADLYGALPEIDRVDFGGEVTVEYVEDGEEYRDRLKFDVVLRDRMGNPLIVATLNDARNPATESMMTSLVERAERVKSSHDELGAAFLVTASFFDPDALAVAAEATKSGFLAGGSKESFVNLSRKTGYHLCLVEALGGEFHVNVPEL